jgi:hypothetical protein
MSRNQSVCVLLLLSGAMGSSAVAATFDLRSAERDNTAVEQSAVTGQEFATQLAEEQQALLVSSTPSTPAAASVSSSSPAAPAAEVVVATPKRSARVRGPESPVRPFSKFAISTKSSTLGAGLQMATPILPWLNLRGGANFFSFNYGTSIDGANYGGNLALRDGQVNLDVFPFHGHGFHISPGVLIFKSDVSATYNVPGGNNFDLGDSTYTSSTSDPVTGSAYAVFSRTLMPSLTVGWGNMITREGKHWTVPFEIGAAYMGPVSMQLNLLGSACNSMGCMSTSNALIQQSVINEQNTLNQSAKSYQFYPIITSGVSYRF